jgi:hypothetical protein
MSTTDGLDRTDSQACAVDRAHDHGVKPERIRPIRRARREHTGERLVRVVPRMHLEHVAAPFVKPRDDDDLVADT